MGIRRLFTVMLVFFSLLPMLLVGHVVSVTMLKTVEKSYTDNLVNTVSLEAENLNQFFLSGVMSVRLLPKAPLVHELLKNSVSENGRQDSVDFMKKEVRSYFTRRAEGQDSVASILLLDRYGTVVCNTVNEDTAAYAFTEEIPDNFTQNGYFISGILQDGRVFGGEKFFYIVCPIMEDDDFLGYMVQFLNMNIFNIIKGHQGSFGQSYFFLIDPNGIFAATGNLNDMRFSVNDETFGGDFASAFYSRDFTAQPSGFIEYKIEGHSRTSYYQVIPASGWVLFSSLARDDIFFSRNKLFQSFVLIFIVLCAVTLLSGILISRWAMHPIAGFICTVEKIQQGDYSSRFMCKGIAEFDHISTVFNQLMDGIEIKTGELEQQAEALRQSNERYRIITDHTKEIIFEWDFQTDKSDYSFTWWKKFGYDPVMNNVSIDFMNADYIHPDDKSVFKSWIEKIFRQPTNSREEFRIKTIDNEYYWVRICTIPIFDQNNTPIKLVGLIQDIDETKKKEIELINRADFDYLSQLYNKAAFDQRISSLLECVQHIALMYIDIDDFRIFNTKYGHAFGDQIIRVIGEKIACCIDNDGFAGRVGGDEFVICVTRPESVSSVDKIAVRLMDMLKEGLYTENTGERVQIKCSIGIVFAPENGTTWQVLSARADKAMYKVKHSGKSNYSIVS